MLIEHASGRQGMKESETKKRLQVFNRYEILGARPVEHRVLGRHDMRLSTTPDLAGAPEPADDGCVGLFLCGIGAGSISSSLHLPHSWASMNYHPWYLLRRSNLRNWQAFPTKLRFSTICWKTPRSQNLEWELEPQSRIRNF